MTLAPALLLAGLLAGELDAKGIHREVVARKGRPVLVSFWATWCAPCLKEFPALIDLARRHPDLAVISVSIDDVSDCAAVEAFVEKHKPPFPVYLKSSTEKDDAFIDRVDPKWQGSVPALLVVDEQGEKRAFVEGEQTPEQMEDLLLGRTPRR